MATSWHFGPYINIYWPNEQKKNFFLNSAQQHINQMSSFLCFFGLCSIWKFHWGIPYKWNILVHLGEKHIKNKKVKCLRHKIANECTWKCLPNHKNGSRKWITYWHSCHSHTSTLTHLDAQLLMWLEMF